MTAELATFFAAISIVVSFGIALGFSLVLLVLPHSPALRAWVASLWLLALSVCFQLIVPPPIGWQLMLLVMLSSLFGAALLIKGVALHAGRRLPIWKPMLVMGPFFLALLIDAQLLHVSGMQRNLSNLSALVMYTWLTWMLLRDTPQSLRLSYRLAGGVFILHMLFCLYGLGFSDEASGSSADERSSAVLLRICGGIVLLMAQCFALMLLLVEQLFCELRDRATHDSMTGLLNRAALMAEGRKRLAEAATKGLPFAALIIDLDHFKRINDSWGHPAGDDVLMHFSTLVRSCVGDRDSLLCRYGGEEFVLLLPGASAAEAMTVAQEILTTVRAASVIAAGQPLRYSVSIGVHEACVATTLEHVLTHADAALYQAKAAGRDRVCIAGASDLVGVRWNPSTRQAAMG